MEHLDNLKKTREPIQTLCRFRIAMVIESPRSKLGRMSTMLFAIKAKGRSSVPDTRASSLMIMTFAISVSLQRAVANVERTCSHQSNVCRVQHVS